MACDVEVKTSISEFGGHFFSLKSIDFGADPVVWCVKLLPAVHTATTKYGHAFESWLLHFPFISLLMLLGKQQRKAHMGHPEDASGLVWPSYACCVAILGVSQLMEDLAVSHLSVTLPSK